MSEENKPSENALVGLESNGMINQLMVDELRKQRSLLVEFTSSQLRKDVDYGIIPGTKKNSLYKPGAEKLRSLFSFSVKVDLVDKEIDRKNNFALYCYKTTVLDRAGRVIAECEGTCNSQEKKYKERKVWISGKQTTEETPIFDILNTLQKMAQKRSFVGAIILACGASDFFTQDIDDPDDAYQMGGAPQMRDVSEVPTVKNVSTQPRDNNQSTILVEALTDYSQKDMVKAAGFRWDKSQKKWLKNIRPEEINSFEFEVRQV